MSFVVKKEKEHELHELTRIKKISASVAKKHL
jgi:hypothetical protein